MEHITLDINDALSFLPKELLDKYKQKAQNHLNSLLEKSGKGNEFLGWMDLPMSVKEDDIKEIENTVSDFREKVDVIVIVGIGGSYLGSRAVIEAMENSFNSYQTRKKNNPILLYAGQNISEDYLSELLEFLGNKSFGICVISKSGTTTEPAIAFRLLKKLLEEKVGVNNAKQYIIAITDASKGALRGLANKKGYHSFIIPEDVGGRFSILSPAGLVPIALAGNNINDLMAGAKYACNKLLKNEFETNIALQYAVIRNMLYDQGKSIEILVNYHPKLHFFSEWWKQLFAESEGKEFKGIFTASVDFTTDLHSLGQYIQEGERKIFETVISLKKVDRCTLIPEDKDDLDGLNYLSGKHVEYVNRMAELGTRQAHISGGVPNIKITIPQLNEYYLGELIFFFQLACGVSGYFLDINPCNQPGVEAYKKNMFRLLGKK